MNSTRYIKKGFHQQRHALFIYFFIAFFSPVIANAQYGIKIGTTVSSFYYPGSTPTPYNGFDIDLRPYLGYDVELVQTNPQKPLFSPFVSVFRRFSLTNRLGIQPELSFSQKGLDYSSSAYENVIYKVKINYLEIPVSFSYEYLQKEKALSHFYLGGYCAYRINAYKKVAFHNTSIQKTKLTSVTNYDLGVHFGVDYKYQIKNHFFLVDIRLFLGLNDLFMEPKDWTSIYFESHKTKITGINLSVGYEI